LNQPFEVVLVSRVSDDVSLCYLNPADNEAEPIAKIRLDRVLLLVSQHMKQLAACDEWPATDQHLRELLGFIQTFADCKVLLCLHLAPSSDRDRKACGWVLGLASLSTALNNIDDVKDPLVSQLPSPS
jgi:hypothetical protein